MFILTGKPFKVDDDIYGGKQQLEVAHLYDEYIIKNANDPSIIEIKIVDEEGKHRSQESIGYEIVCHMIKRLNKQIYDTS